MVSLVKNHRAREVHVYAVSVLSNDKGVQFGDQILLPGTYDYQLSPERRLLFLPNSVPQRSFVVCRASGSEAARALFDWCKQRFTCRQFDCEDITERYLPDS